MKELRTREEIRDFVVWIKHKGWVVYGEKVAVVRDPAEEKFSEHIIAPDTHKAIKLTGTVVAVGLGIDKEHRNLAGLCEGDKVTFSKYHTLQTSWPDRDGEDVEVDLFHAADIYVGRRPDDALFQKKDVE